MNLYQKGKEKIKKSILRFTRHLVPLMPKGKSLMINMVLALVGNKFEDEIILKDGRKFYIKEISPINRSLFFLNKYENHETRIIEKLVKAEDYVFDIGANFGWYTILMSRLVGKLGKVFAFELVPSITEELNKNISLNHLDNVTAENMGVGEHEGEGKYFYSENWGTGNLKPAMLGGALKEGRIKMTSLDKYVEKNNIKKVSFIKCDIDGAEVLFLRGARKILASEKPAIVIEAHERGQRAQGHSCQEIFTELQQFGYKFFSLDNKLKAVLNEELEKFDPSFVDNILCLPDGKLDLLSKVL